MEKFIMRKQIIAAAVAATMTSVALADISITGQMKVNYNNKDNNGTVTNKVVTESNLYITGKSGDTTVYTELDYDTVSSASTGDFEGASDGQLDVEDQWMSTKIGDVALKVGTWNGSDTIISADSTRIDGKWEAKTSFAGVDLTIDGGNDLEGSTSGETGVNVKVAGTVAGINVSAKKKNGAKEYTLGGSFAGVDVAYHSFDDDRANYDKSSILIGTNVGDVRVEYAQATADSSAVISGDSWFGDAAVLATNAGAAAGMSSGDDIKGFGVKTAVAGNTVQAKFFTVEDSGATDIDNMKFIVTRPLAGGTTLEVIYHDQDSTTAASDSETVDVELAVKF
jgi:hypothetical protein